MVDVVKFSNVENENRIAREAVRNELQTHFAGRTFSVLSEPSTEPGKVKLKLSLVSDPNIKPVRGDFELPTQEHPLNQDVSIQVIIGGCQNAIADLEQREI
jgi:hypothetical protein